MNPRRLLGALVVAGLLSVFVYGVLAALSDVRSVAASLSQIPVGTYATVLGLSLVCFATRSLRWGYLTRRAGAPLRTPDAFYVQMSGMTMTVTPGKIGEVLKAFLMRSIAGLPMTRGVALVFAERVADLIAVVLLSMGGLTLLRGNAAVAMVAAAVVVAAGVAVASSHRFHETALRIVERQPWAREHHASARAISETVRDTLRPGPLLVSVAASTLAWGAEGVGLWVTTRALGFAGATLWAAVAVYAISTLIGALAFVPGGIGLTEASLAGLLIAMGASAPVATAATVVTRIATLWFGVAIGWLFLASRPALMRGFFAGDPGDDAPDEVPATR